MPKQLISTQEAHDRLLVLALEINKHCTKVNYGGCAVMAGIAGERLMKFGFECDVMTPADNYDYGTAPNKVRPLLHPAWTIADWHNNGVSFGHVAVRFRDDAGDFYTWDTDVGVLAGQWNYGQRLSTGKPYKGHAWGDELTVGECIRLARSTDWNTEFNRKQIPLMRHLGDHHLTFGL